MHDGVLPLKNKREGKNIFFFFKSRLFFFYRKWSQLVDIVPSSNPLDVNVTYQKTVKHKHGIETRFEFFKKEKNEMKKEEEKWQKVIFIFPSYSLPDE